MKARAHIFVSGWVQGVFFRDQTQKWANSLSVTGWVRNLRDGRVEVTAEGDKEKVEDLINQLKQGPSLARVEKVEIEWEDYAGEFSNFNILHTNMW